MAQENQFEDDKYENQRMVTYVSPIVKKEALLIAKEKFGIKKSASVLKMALKLFILNHKPKQ